MNDLDIDIIDPGIRRTIVLLRSWGFNTTDSGDGVSKGDMDFKLTFPHVAILTAKEDLVSETDRLRAKVESIGVEVEQDSLTEYADFSSGVRITAQYCPVDQAPIIVITGFHDGLLADSNAQN